MTWYYIISGKMESPYTMKASELPPSKNTKPRSNFPNSLAFTYTLDGMVQKAMKFTGSLSIPECSVTDFQYWILAPIFDNGWALLGELNKIIPVSETRFIDLSVVGDAYIAHLVGVQGEKVPVSVYNTHNETTTVYTCTIGPSGSSVLYLPYGLCDEV